MNKFGLYFARAISFILLFCPRFIQKAISKLLAWLWWDVFKLRRWTIFKNLALVFPDISHEKKVELAKESLFWMSYHLIEFLRIPNFNLTKAKKQAIFHNIENYEKARSKNKGVLFLSLHIGGGDISTAWMSISGIPCHLISKKFKQKWINDFWFGVRELKGTKFIDPHGKSNAFEILAALKKNENVIFVLDQFMGKPYGIETDFFGKKTGTAYGLALFALKTKAPVVPIFTITDQNNKQHIYFEPEVIYESEFENRDLQIKMMTTQYNQVLEKIILRFPEQWMWVHRRWKKWE